MTSREKGDISEARFKSMCQLKGWQVYKSTPEEDMFKHIDFYVLADEGEWSVDVNTQVMWSASGSNLRMSEATKDGSMARPHTSALIHHSSTNSAL